MSQKNFFLLFIFLIFCGGCGSKHLIKYYDDINHYLIDKDYDSAISAVEKNKDKIYGDKSQLLYFLDKGYFSHLAGNYELSNEAFTNAKNLYDDYFTKSITNTAFSFAANDKVQPYYGQPFEISLLYIFKALNYLKLGDNSSAAVEARAANHYLKTLNKKRRKTRPGLKEFQPSKKSIF